MYRHVYRNNAYLTSQRPCASFLVVSHPHSTVLVWVKLSFWETKQHVIFTLHMEFIAACPIMSKVALMLQSDITILSYFLWWSYWKLLAIWQWRAICWYVPGWTSLQDLGRILFLENLGTDLPPEESWKDLANIWTILEKTLPRSWQESSKILPRCWSWSLILILDIFCFCGIHQQIQYLLFTLAKYIPCKH